MNLVGSSFFTVADQPASSQGGTGAGPVIVWLHGEHDLSTDDALSMTLARAIALDGAGLVLDLSEVAFIAVSTLRVILRAQEFLQHRSRSLTVRSPSPCARRAIGACGLDDRLGLNPEGLSAEVRLSDEGIALRTWVEVPAGRQRMTKALAGGGRLARSGW
jgi:anti-anti-sigma factor